MIAQQYAWEPLVPYTVLMINSLFFSLIRALSNRLIKPSENNTRISVVNLFIQELLATCELCIGCAELNMVHQLHGPVAYGLTLAVLTYFWTEAAFGDAHTTPGYMLEELISKDDSSGNQESLTNRLPLLQTQARLAAQLAAVPLALPISRLYWTHRLITAHEQALDEQCKTSLTTSVLVGFMIEFFFSACCRLNELIGQRLVETNHFGRRSMATLNALLSSALVVLAFETSGGYFNPILAASLEYGCGGIETHQHAFVFWLGPMLGHLLARVVFNKRYASALVTQSGKQVSSPIQRRNSQKKKSIPSNKRAQQNIQQAKQEISGSEVRSTRKSNSRHS